VAVAVAHHQKYFPFVVVFAVAHQRYSQFVAAAVAVVVD